MKKTLKLLGVSLVLVFGFVALPLTAQAGKKVVNKNSTNVTVNNVNNAVVVSGNICVANTGGNEQKNNDDRNRIRTGSASSTCGSVVNANQNITIVAVGQSNN